MNDDQRGDDDDSDGGGGGSSSDSQGSQAIVPVCITTSNSVKDTIRERANKPLGFTYDMVCGYGVCVTSRVPFLQFKMNSLSMCCWRSIESPIDSDQNSRAMPCNIRSALPCLLKVSKSSTDNSTGKERENKNEDEAEAEEKDN
jgi:hypothetical protein